VDASRALSPTGRTEIELLADRCAAAGLRVRQIRHSGLVRARQTAEILAAKLAPPGGVQMMRGITPDGDEVGTAIELEALDEPVLVVSHMPFVAALCESMTGAPAQPFRTGEMRCLVRRESGWIALPF
jgi:phosphohistidine phosphatase